MLLPDEMRLLTIVDLNDHAIQINESHHSKADNAKASRN